MNTDGKNEDVVADKGLDSGPFYAYIRVTSFELQPDEITRFLNIIPDDFHNIGDANPYHVGGIYKWSKWKKYLNIDASTSSGSYGLTEAIEALGDDLANRLGELSQRSCEVSLSIVQEFDDPEGDTGIFFTANAVHWLATAGAYIDIDQYLLIGPDDAEPNASQ